MRKSVCLLALILFGLSSNVYADGTANIRRLVAEVQQHESRIEILEQRIDSRPFTPTNYSAFGDEVSSALAPQLEDLESAVENLSGKVSDFTGDETIVHSGSSASTLKISGRVHLDYWDFSNTSGDIANMEGTQAAPLDPQNRFGFRRLRFGVSGKVKDNMLYKIESEFAGGNDVTFKDAYLGWSEVPFLRTVLLGNQKRPYGLDHLNSSRYNVFMERPYVIEAFNQDARRLGLASYGVSENQRYNWRWGVWNQRDVAGSGNYVSDSLQLEFAGRFANTIWYDECSGGRGYAHWAISGSYADPDGFGGAGNEARFRTRPEARSSRRWLNTGRIDGADDYTLMGLEGVINLGRIQLVGEYQNTWVNRVDGFGDQLDFHGGYLYVSYFLTGEHMPWGRESGTLARIKPFQNFWSVRGCDGCVHSGWGAWQLAARYSKGDFTDSDIFGGVGESFTAGLNWYWNPNARMQFNYITGSIDDRYATLDNGDYDLFGTRFMIDF